MRVEVVGTLDELRGHGRTWDALSYIAPQGVPSLTYAWVSSFLEHRLRPGQEWRCLFAYQGQTLAGVLPVLLPEGETKASRSLQAPNDLHTHCGDFLLGAGMEAEAFASLVEALAGVVPNWTGLRLSNLTELSPTLVMRPGGARQWHVFTEPAGFGAYLPTSGDFADYHKSLSPKWRKELRQCRRRLDELGGVEIDFLAGADASDEHLETFFALEGSGWKGQEGTSIMSSQGRKRFYTTLAGRLREAGMLELHLLRAGGRPVAGHFAVRMRHRLTIWKSGYDESLAKFSPGNVLCEEMLRRAFSDPDVKELDSVSDQAWFKRWRMDRRPYYHMTVSPGRLLPYLRHAVAFGTGRFVEWVRDSVKQSPVLKPVALKVRSLVMPPQ